MGLNTDERRDVVDTQSHLFQMMSHEKNSGEFYLAAVVQDSLTYTLHQYADSGQLMDVAHETARVCVIAATQSIGHSASVMTEAVRGVMHTLVSLGGDPREMAVAVTTGASKALGKEHVALAGTYRDAIVSGIQSALNDLGVVEPSILPITSHLVAQCFPFSMQ